MNHRAAAVAVSIGAALAVAFASACSNVPTEQPCRDIPDGGCPAYDNACEDPTCTALYLCEADRTWQLDLVCPAKEAGAPVVVDGSSDAIADVVDHSDADYIDVPGALGGPGCEDLEVPDCALGVAAACSNGCCGCEDLYVCQSGGWNLYATCDNGAITLTPTGN